ncbi:Rnase h, partial [Globisporangium splendens]
MPKTAGVVTIQETRDAAAAAQQYADGLRTGNIKAVQDVYHQDATISGLPSDATHPVVCPIKSLYDNIERHNGAPEAQTRVDVLAMTPTTAAVRVEIETGGNDDYIDFLTLVKIDGKWTIVAKVFHAYY